jgi:hypothetical protein
LAGAIPNAGVGRGVVDPVQAVSVPARTMRTRPRTDRTARIISWSDDYGEPWAEPATTGVVVNLVFTVHTSMGEEEPSDREMGVDRLPIWLGGVTRTPATLVGWQSARAFGS